MAEALPETSGLSSSQGSNAREYVAALTGLRGIAAFSVFLFHYSALHPGIRLDLSVPVIGYFLQLPLGLGFAGVDLFFVLSGFLLALPFARASLNEQPAPDRLNYFKRRLLRVFPRLLRAVAYYSDHWRMVRHLEAFKHPLFSGSPGDVFQYRFGADTATGGRMVDASGRVFFLSSIALDCPIHAAPEMGFSTRGRNRNKYSLSTLGRIRIWKHTRSSGFLECITVTGFSARVSAGCQCGHAGAMAGSEPVPTTINPGRGWPVPGWHYSGRVVDERGCFNVCYRLLARALVHGHCTSCVGFSINNDGAGHILG